MPTPTTAQLILSAAFMRSRDLPWASCPPGARASDCVSLLNEPITTTPTGSMTPVTWIKMPQDFSRGLAYVRFSYTPGGIHEIQSLGRDANGQWKLFMLSGGGNPPPWLVQLPGDAVACSYGIMPARLLAQPSTSSDGPVLKDGDKLRLEELRLEVEGTVTPGKGFYRVSAPSAGWVYSDFVANALWDSCPSLR